MTGFDFLAQILTEKVILSLIITFALFCLILVLIIIVRYGVHIEFGWKHFKLYTEQKQENISVEKIAEEVETHLSALDSYKNSMLQYEASAKTTIAHQIDNLRIPEIEDKTQNKIMVLAVKWELLLINVENHYFSIFGDSERIVGYIEGRYARLVKIFDQYIDDPAKSQKETYDVLCRWWDIVRSTVLSTALQKKASNISAKSIFVDSSWSSRMTEDMNNNEQVISVLNSLIDLRPYVSAYFENNLGCDVPDYLKKEKTVKSENKEENNV